MRKNKYTSPIIILTLSIIVYLAADMLSSFRGRSSINYKLLPLNTTITWGGYNLYSFVPIEVEDRCKFYEEGLPISVYNPDDKLDTIHFKTIVEYGVRKDRLIFHAKDIDDTDIYILRAKDKSDTNRINDHIITIDNFIRDEYHWINLQEINMPWQMIVVLMFLLGVFGTIISLLWILFLLYRRIQNRKKEFIILISTLVICFAYCIFVDIYLFYKGSSLGSYDHFLPFNTHIDCMGDRYSFEWIGGDYCEFINEGIPLRVMTKDGQEQIINQKTILQYGFKRGELIYQIESIEGNKYYIRKIDNFNEYLISEDDIDKNDYRWKNFELSIIDKILAVFELLGLLCFVVSGILLVIYVIEASIHPSKMKQLCIGKI